MFPIQANSEPLHEIADSAAVCENRCRHSLDSLLRGIRAPLLQSLHRLCRSSSAAIGFIEYLSFFKYLPHEVVAHLKPLPDLFRGTAEQIYWKARSKLHSDLDRLVNASAFKWPNDQQINIRILRDYALRMGAKKDDPFGPEFTSDTPSKLLYLAHRYHYETLHNRLCYLNGLHCNPDSGAARDYIGYLR